jgi:hypothetical protein
MARKAILFGWSLARWITFAVAVMIIMFLVFRVNALKGFIVK